MAIMTGGALLASSIIGGVMQDRAARRAANAQTAAANMATAEEARQFDIAREDLAPYRDAGTAAVGRIRDLLGLSDSGSGELDRRFTVGDFWNDPVVKLGFESGLNEGRTALDNSFGARGLRNSGARLKALTEFGQDYAGQRANDAYTRFYADQDRRLNRLSALAGTGQTATQNTAALGNAMAGRVGDIITSAGNARGAAAIARGNAFAGGLNTVGNWFGQQDMLDRLVPRRSRNISPYELGDVYS